MPKSNTLHGQSCDPTKDGLLVSSTGTRDNLTACSQSCQKTAQCVTVTYFISRKLCSHYSTTCPNLHSDDRMITVRVPKSITLRGQSCDPTKDGLLDSSTGTRDSLAACSQSCQDTAKCVTVTYFISRKLCSHYSTTCPNLHSDDRMITVRVEPPNTRGSVTTTSPPTTAMPKLTTLRGSTFCDEFVTTCGKSWSDCKTDFAKLEKGSGTGSANTQACRVFHLSLAQKGKADAQVHCPHASKMGGGVCVTAKGTCCATIAIALS